MTTLEQFRRKMEKEYEKLFVMDRAYAFLEYFLKTILYPESINQNKWRNEMSNRLAECSRLKRETTKKKFSPRVYDLIFTMYCSTPEELKENILSYSSEFEDDDLPLVNIEKVDINAIYSIFMDLKEKCLKLLVSNEVQTGEEFRKIIDEVVKL